VRESPPPLTVGCRVMFEELVAGEAPSRLRSATAVGRLLDAVAGPWLLIGWLAFVLR